MVSETIAKLTIALGVYCISIAVLGTLLNGIIFLVCLRKNLRKINAFKFFAIISIADTISLYEWNINHFSRIFFKKSPSFTSLVWCRLGTYLQYVSLEYSAWLLVSVALDRFLMIKYRQWKTGFFKGKIVVFYALIICALLMILDSCTLATNGYIEYINGTEKLICFAWHNNDYTLFDFLGRIHLYTYSIVPFVMLVFLNSSLLYYLFDKKSHLNTAVQNAHSDKKMRQMTKTIVTITILFIALTLPGAIVSGYFYNDLIQTELGRFILVLIDNITFSYHSFNFFVLLTTNTKFRSELRETFCSVFSKENSSNNSPNNKNTKK